jgi:hypothetical protein
MFPDAPVLINRFSSHLLFSSTAWPNLLSLGSESVGALWHELSDPTICQIIIGISSHWQHEFWNHTFCWLFWWFVIATSSPWHEFWKRTSVSVIMSVWHSNVIFMTWQCDKFDIVTWNSHIAMSNFSLIKWYTSVKRFTCACQNSHSYIKISQSYVNQIAWLWQIIQLIR